MYNALSPCSPLGKIQRVDYMNYYLLDFTSSLSMTGLAQVTSILLPLIMVSRSKIISYM